MRSSSETPDGQADRRTLRTLLNVKSDVQSEP
jgi:hypothetical protein